MTNLIALPRLLRVGDGSLAALPELLRCLGSNRPLIVTDQFMRDNGVVDAVTQSVSGQVSSVEVFDGVVPDPSTDSLRPGIAMMANNRCDSVIGLGGGSSLDSAKAIALLAASGRPMREFKAPTVTDMSDTPVIAIPTTAGSGSEATRFTVITDSDTNEKMLCPGLAFLPAAAIVDYSLTMTMPARLTADTGIDALTHAVEAYVSRRASLFTDSLSLASIAAIGRYLRRAYSDPDDAEAREQMMLASTQAGIAFSNSSVALVHGMSRPLGSHFHLSHGLSNAILFPAVTEFSLPEATMRYADCARAYGAAGASATDEQAARALIDALWKLNQDLHVPTLTELEVSPEKWEKMLPVMAIQALESGSPQNNPRVPTEDEIADLYRSIF